MRKIKSLVQLLQIENGCILNLDGGLTGIVGNVIHPCKCPHLKGMNLTHPKYHARNPSELEDWLRRQGGSIEKKCRYMK